MIHTLNGRRRGKESGAALKIDIVKVCDKLEWFYLEKVIEKMGFCAKWIQLVMQHVRTVRFHILLEGESIGLIVLEMGIRQGDPLSPYLFIIGAEGLSALIRKRELEGSIHGCKVSASALSITHLFFANDSYLFF